MFHLLWYILIGLISRRYREDPVMHVHMTIFWTVVLPASSGSIIGGGVSHMLFRAHQTTAIILPASFCPTLGAILVLYICFKLNIHFPQAQPGIPIGPPRLGLPGKRSPCDISPSEPPRRLKRLVLAPCSVSAAERSPSGST